MDIFAIGGLLLGFLAVIGGQVLEGGSIMALVQPTAFMIVVGGSIGATVLSFTSEELKNGVGTLSLIFQGHHQDPKAMIQLLISLATKARKEGILALQNDISQIEDPFL